MGQKRFTKSQQQLQPDPRYDSKLVTRVVNVLMLDGKKSTAQRIVYDAMDQVSNRVKDAPPLEVLEKAIGNIKPLIEVRSRRVGGANYQVPRQVNSRRQLSLALRWLRDAVRKGKGESISRRLARELMDAYRGEGAAVATKENVHRMAEANKAFAHFAW